MFNAQPQKIPRQKSEKCEIIVEKVGNKIKKSIRGNCSKEQLKALSGEETIYSE